MTVVYASPEHIPFLLTIAPKLPTLKLIISIEPLEDDEKRVLVAWGKTSNVKVKDIAEGTLGLMDFSRSAFIRNL